MIPQHTYNGNLSLGGTYALRELPHRAVVQYRPGEHSVTLTSMIDSVGGLRSATPRTEDGERANTPEKIHYWATLPHQTFLPEDTEVTLVWLPPR